MREFREKSVRINYRKARLSLPYIQNKTFNENQDLDVDISVFQFYTPALSTKTSTKSEEKCMKKLPTNALGLSLLKNVTRLF